jgi:lysophospholipase L1-like esterase
MERILPFGDSITVGTLPGGWRKILGERLTAEGSPATFVGTKQDAFGGYTATIGISSAKAVDEIADALAAGVPTVTVLLLGTNDVYFGAPTDFLFGKWTAIADAVLASGSRLVACTIPPMKDPARAPFIDEWNKRVRAYVASAQAAGKVVVLCDVFPQVLAEYHLSADGVHPNGGGYSKIAGAIYDAARPWLIVRAPATASAPLPVVAPATPTVPAPAPLPAQAPLPAPSMASVVTPTRATLPWGAVAGAFGLAALFAVVVRRRAVGALR